MPCGVWVDLVRRACKLPVREPLWGESIFETRDLLHEDWLRRERFGFRLWPRIGGSMLFTFRVEMDTIQVVR